MKEDLPTRLEQSDLLNEQVHADELQELLTRLAATEALFAEPVPTIRDVAEATDASPLLIGRILGQMRAPDEVAVLNRRMDGFEDRLRKLERYKATNSKSKVEIRDLVLRSDRATFEPLTHPKTTTSVQSDMKARSWTEEKDLEKFIAAWKKAEVTPESSGAFMLVVTLGIILMLVGTCQFLPRQVPGSMDRDVPFPIERSVR